MCTHPFTEAAGTRDCEASRADRGETMGEKCVGEPRIGVNIGGERQTVVCLCCVPAFHRSARGLSQCATLPTLADFKMEVGHHSA